MAEIMNCQNIKRLRKCIREATLKNTGLSSGPFKVLAIHRYPSDPKHRTQIGIAGTAQSDVFDVIEITLADDEHKVKAVLVPELNNLVQTCQLQAGHLVKVTEARVHYDETDLSSGCVIIVNSVDITGYEGLQDQSALTDLKWADDCSASEQLDVPLTSSRGYYINVWSTTEMYGDLWKTSIPDASDLGSTKPEEIYCIKDLPKSWSSTRVTNPTLLVRVLLKSRMLHYAKSGKNDKWPFQAHLLIADKTGACTSVLWNSMCPNFYYSVKEGTVLLLKKFTCKKSFTVLPRFRPCLRDTQFYDIDINLNSHHPESEVKVIDEASLPDNIELPSLQYNFVSRRQASSLPDNFMCDIAGVVTYVGRYEREHIANKFGVDTGGFWIRRWIHIRDSSCNKPFCVQVYRVAQGMHGCDFVPGRWQIFTHVRLVNKMDRLTSSHSQRHLFFTTTAETQISVMDGSISTQLKNDARISSVMKWGITDQCRQAVGEALVGGYINFPPLPSNIDQLKGCFRDWQITPSSDWERILKGLSFREARQLVMQATMVHVSLTLDTSRRKDVSPSKKSKLDAREVILDQTAYSNMSSGQVLGPRQLAEDISFPMLHKPEQWSVIRQQLDFPATKLDQKNSHTKTAAQLQDLQHLTSAYFTVTWSGLNSKILLQSHYIPPSTLTSKCDLMTLLQGKDQCQGSRSPVKDRMEALLDNILKSANECTNRRFLVVLDCYQGNPEHTELMVNRALPL
ncbi:RPA-related protein RADX-like [Mya arenaria]|uniref:RPA-related protein RADX-like n=1 Tax=Mya arenaria TaxID=6604 RepID=UPI0022E2A2A0|nr:RPA-related protein RADX-like [Mya arenaria]